jgi:hypothetical protein
MRSKLVHEAHGQRTFVVVLGAGDKARDCVGRYAGRERLSAAQVTAIGAFGRAALRFFGCGSNEYRPIPGEEQVEVASPNGDFALDGAGKPTLHLHAVLGCRNWAAVGGDLQEGRVRPTLEVVMTGSPSHLRRVHDPETGLASIRVRE